MFDVTCLDKYGNTVTHFTQWDLNQTLYIEDHGFTTPPQFHFCNMNSEKALVVSSTFKDGVLEVVVPNMLLVEPYTITLYVYLSENDSGKTVEYMQIPVRPRPQPDSFEYEDNVVLVDVQELANEIRALNASMSSAEEERVASELNRISNETERQNAEADRKSSETIRINAETERVDAENLRKENEVTRIENEDTRKSAEQTRVDAEVERVNAENIRKENEANRLSAETERSEAETERIEAETNRVNAESERVESENERSDSEAIRVIAENERVSAEAIRQSQEETRQSNTATAITNAEAATNRANIAAEACEEIVAGTGFISVTEKGATNGVATLDGNGKVPLEQLPDNIGGDTVPEGVTYIDFENPTGEEVGDILPIDADTLGGHGVDYFATVDDIPTVDTNLSAESYNPIANKAVAEAFEHHVVKKYKGASEEAINSIYDSLHSNANDGEWYEATVSHQVAHSVMAGGQHYVYGVRTSELYGWQCAMSYDDTPKMFYRSLINGTWKAWKSLTNYVPLTGGTVSGTIVQDVSGDLYNVLKNQSRSISNMISSNGVYEVYDSTNQKTIIRSTLDGTNTFNGIASENLPITGGEVNGNLTVKSNHFALNAPNSEPARFYLANTLRNLMWVVGNDGSGGLYDNTNNKFIINISADGNTNTWQGVASGNLPLTGGVFPKLSENDGGRVQFEKPDNSPIVGNLFMDLNSVNGLRFFEGGSTQRGAYLNITKCGVGCSSEILHTGNSAKTVVLETDPGEGATVNYSDGTVVFTK